MSTGHDAPVDIDRSVTVRDTIHRDDNRVEAFETDDGCEVAVFPGPRAAEQAKIFGPSCYGPALRDPEGHDHIKEAP